MRAKEKKKKNSEEYYYENEGRRGSKKDQVAEEGERKMTGDFVCFFSSPFSHFREKNMLVMAD